MLKVIVRLVYDEGLGCFYVFRWIKKIYKNIKNSVPQRDTLFYFYIFTFYNIISP